MKKNRLVNESISKGIFSSDSPIEKKKKKKRKHSQTKMIKKPKPKIKTHTKEFKIWVLKKIILINLPERDQELKWVVPCFSSLE